MTHQQLIERLIKSPLYQKYEIKTNDIDTETKKILLSDSRFDMYCPACRKTSTWVLLVDPELKRRSDRESATSVLSSHGGFGGSVLTYWVGEFKLRISCTRVPQHTAIFHFVSSKANASEEEFNPHIVKIGQNPSLADFESGDLSGLEKGLTKAQRGDFVRAIRTASHGFFVAACVYYRRVFESIIDDAKKEYMKKNELKEWAEYESTNTTTDRIKLLKSELPTFLSDHPNLYKLLSIGVHNLTEQDCGQEILSIRQAIEHIVRSRIILRQQEEESETLSKLISQSVDKHTNID